MAPNSRRKKSRSPSPWPSLPPDVAGEVLLRLPSYADRICLAAACRSWRASAALYRSPPRLPCLVFGDGTFRGFPEGERPFRLPSAAGFLGSCGEWLVFKHGAGTGGGYSLSNPFSNTAAVMAPLPSPSCVRARHEPVFQAAAERAVPEYDQIGLWANEPEPPRAALSVRKLVVCSAGVVAAVIGGEEEGRLGKLAVCRPGAPSWSVSVHDQWRRIKDMAVHRGTLYAVDHNEDLLAVSVGEDGGDGGPAVSGIARAVTGAPPDFSGRRRLTLHYLVDTGGISGAGGALLMVRREVCRGRPEQGRGIEERFTVFEANFAAARWEELRALGDGVALLVGRWCSAAVRVPEERRRQWGGFIYFLEDGIVDQQNREYSLSANDYNDGAGFPTYMLEPVMWRDDQDLPATWLLPPQEGSAFVPSE